MTDSSTHREQSAQNSQQENEPDSTWYSGPVDPRELEKYFEWVIEEHDGSLMERAKPGNTYSIDVQRMEMREDGKWQAVTDDGGDTESEEAQGAV